MVLFDFTFTIKGPDNTELVKKTTAETREDGIQQVGEELVTRGSITSIEEFLENYTVSETRYQFSNSPWVDADGLKSDLESIPDVSYARYSDPYVGAYEPPTFHLGVSPDSDIESVKQAVKDYFGGFDIAVKNGNVVIRFTNPLKE